MLTTAATGVNQKGFCYLFPSTSNCVINTCFRFLTIKCQKLLPYYFRDKNIIKQTKKLIGVVYYRFTNIKAFLTMLTRFTCSAIQQQHHSFKIFSTYQLKLVVSGGICLTSGCDREHLQKRESGSKIMLDDVSLFVCKGFLFSENV